MMTHLRAACRLGLLAAAMAAVPASAAPATARLVRCGADECLLVRGHRATPDAMVTINGRPVTVRGRNGWEARLPVQTVREWSAPFARTLRVAVAGAAEPRDDETVRLPVGLLGARIELASLVVHAR